MSSTNADRTGSARKAHRATASNFTSNLLGACEAVWAAIQQRHDDVPRVVTTMGSGTLGRRGEHTLAHLAPGRWHQGEHGRVAELFISGEGLQRGPVDTLGSLLHEAAHGAALVRGVRDTSRAGRYHNRRFLTIGEELGLALAHHPSIGWSLTTVPPATQATYKAQVDLLAAALVGYRLPESARKRPNSNNPLALRCPCDRRIRVAPTVLRQGPIICGVCRTPFD